MLSALVHQYSILSLVSRLTLRRSRLLQIGLLILIWLAGQAIAQIPGAPLPGSIIGLFILLALLCWGKVRSTTLARGTEWFLAEMLLFFIPAVPAVLQHKELFGWLGVKILLVILLGTIVVMLTTAGIVEFCFHRLEKPHTEENAS